MNHTRYFFIVALCLVSGAVSAQWQWVDKDGRKVFSDRAPPADIAEKSILKRPIGKDTSSVPSTSAPDSAGATAAAAAAASAPAASAPQVTRVDKELLDKKKKAEELEAAKRQAEKERVQAAKADNCLRARQLKASLTSNTRLVQINEKGERVLVDDAKRAAELQRAQGFIDSDC